MRFHAQRLPLGGTGGPLHGCRRSRGPRSWSQETRRARWRGFVRGVDMGGPGPTGRPYPTALECRAVDAPTGGGQGQARARARARAEGEAWPTPRTWRCYWSAPGCAPGGGAVAYGVCRRGGIASERLGARLSVAGRAVQCWSIAGERPVKARLSVTGRACVRGSCVRAW